MNFQIEQLRRLPQRGNEVWQGGLVKMPSWVLGEDERPYRPWLGMWISTRTELVQVSSPSESRERDLSVAFRALLDYACDAKLAGYRPGILEVCDKEVAAYLEGLVGEAGIAVRRRSRLFTLEQALESMETALNDGQKLPSILKAKGVGKAELGAFAAAADLFYTRRVWQYLTTDDFIEIEQPFVNAKLRCATVMGCGGETYGISFYDSRQQYETLYEDLDDSKDIMLSMKPWSIIFGPIMELPFEEGDVWEEEDFPAADPEAYPFAAHYLGEGKIKRPGREILAFMEGLLRALSLSEEEEMDTGRWRKTVTTFAGEMEFVLALPDLLQPVSEATSAAGRKQKLARGVYDRRGMEGMLAQVHRMLEGQDFESKEEMQAFLNENAIGKDIPKQSPRTDLEKAQDLMYEAFEAKGRRQLQMAREALAICPDCADAYVLLAEREGDPDKALAWYEKGMAAGERALGEAFFEEEAGHFWGIMETRPYMRARAGVANVLEALGRCEEAMAHYRELLRLNPNDNQGVRFSLLSLYLQESRDKEARDLLKAYPDDKSMATGSYAQALLSYRKEGDSATARRHLKKALETNRHVPGYLLGEEEFPPIIPPSYSLGSIDEAVLCADNMLEAWEEPPEALEWLDEYRRSGSKRIRKKSIKKKRKTKKKS